MNTIAKELNKHLQAFFDTEDEIYKSLISDDSGVPDNNPHNPVELNIGAIGGLLEWNRRLSMSLVKQLFFDKAEGKFLKLTIFEILGIVKGEGETDAEYKTRVKDIILGHKLSPAAIIYNTRPYSTSEPVLLEGDLEGAYAGVSYAGVYEDFKLENKDEWIFPAISTSSTRSAYFFILMLENTKKEAIPLLVDKVNRLIASGVNYEIRIDYTQ